MSTTLPSLVCQATAAELQCMMSAFIEFVDRDPLCLRKSPGLADSTKDKYW